MHKIKIILFTLASMVAILVTIISFILNSYNNQDYKQLLIKTVNTLSDYTLSIEGHFDLQRSFTPEVSASIIELHSDTDNTHIRIDNFRIQITLSPLLNNTLLINDLLVEKMQIELHASEETQNSANFFSYLPVPIIEHAALNNIQLITHSDNQTHTIGSLIISSENRQAPLVLEGNGVVRGHPFDIKGQLGPLVDIFKQEAPYPVNLVANWKHAQLYINGTIQDPPQGEDLDLVGKLNIPEVANIVTASIPVKGHLQSTFHLKGTFNEPELAEIQASLINKKLMNLQLAGSIGNLMAQEEIDLHLSGYIHDIELLKWILPDSSPAFNSVNIETDVVDEEQIFSLKNIDVNLSNDQGLSIDLSGKSSVVMQSQPFRNLEIQAAINSRDTETLKPYLGRGIPEMGPIQGTTLITTKGKGFILSHINVIAGVDKKVQLTAKGQVEFLSIDSQNERGKVALDIALNAMHSSDLTKLLDIEHPEIGPISMIANLNGSFKQLTLGNMDLKAGKNDILSLQAGGWITWDKLDSGSPQQLTDITLQAFTPSLQYAARLYDEDSPDLGAAKLSMRIHGKGEVLEGSDLIFHIGSKKSLFLTIQGKVAQIFYADLFYKGIELTGTLEGKSTSHLAELLENTKIPDIGAISGKLIILGDSNNLQISQISLSAGRKKQLLLTASGKIADIPLRQELPPQGVEMALTFTAPNSADLSAIMGSNIPDLGRLVIKGQLTDKSGVLTIQDLVLTAGDPKQPTISMSGSVEDVLSTTGLQMKVLFDEKTLVKLLNLQSVSGLGEIKGSALLSNASGFLSINDLKIESGDLELINLKIIGAIKDVTTTGMLTANVQVSIKQPEQFAKLFSINLTGLGPISASGLIGGDKNRMTYKGHSFIGKTVLTGDLVLSLMNATPKITGEITSPNIFLEDFGIVTKVSATSREKDSKTAKTALFNDTPISLDALHKVDVDLKLSLFKMTGIDYQLNRVKTHLSLQKGNLAVSPFGFDFSEGHFAVNARINAREIPEWQFSIEGDSIRLGEVFRKQNKTPPVEGDLNFIVDLNSSGLSTRDIAANLDGEIGFTLENGGVSRSQLELVFLNPLGWLFSHGITGDEFHISCGLGRYQVKKGIISSKVFLIDGPKLFVRGDTEVNLVNETINSVYNLEKKNIFENTIIPTLAPTSVPIKISGNLSDPTIKEVSKPSVISKADRYIFAPVAMIPQEVLGTVFDLFEESNEVQSPCTPYLKK